MNCISLPRKILKAKTFVSLILCLILLNYFGAFTHIFERDFDTDFNYPLQGDILKYVRQLRNGDAPSVPAINNKYNHTFLSNAGEKCLDGDRLLRPRLVILVKSAMDHFENRLFIRQSWGYEKRFSDVIIRTVFLLGVPGKPDSVLSNKINAESAKFKDIVQANFTDTYFNNTIKTMMGMKWAVSHCPHAKFYFYVDDDYYVSVKNVLMFVRNPVNYPEYLEEAHEVMRKAARRLSSSHKSNQTYDILLKNGIPDSAQPKKRQTRHILDYELTDDVRLFTGYVFKSSPHRHRSSKWYISLEEYPWHLWPTYVTAGAFVLSREALHDMYYSSFYTKHFRFDDIFLGLVAKKAHIEPLHSDQFYFYRAPYSEPHSYKYLIASHGFGNPKEMFKVFTQLRSAGYA